MVGDAKADPKQSTDETKTKTAEEKQEDEDIAIESSPAAMLACQFQEWFYFILFLQLYFFDILFGKV